MSLFSMLMLLGRTQMCRHIADGRDQLGRVLDVIRRQANEPPDLRYQRILYRLSVWNSGTARSIRTHFSPLERLLRLSGLAMREGMRAACRKSRGDALSATGGGGNSGAIAARVSAGVILLALSETGFAG